MFNLIYRSLTATILFAVLLCGVYPLMITFSGKILFPDVSSGGRSLIGQAFTKAEYFHGRPSAAGSGKGYDATRSSGSNLGPTNRKWVEKVKANVEQVLRENPTMKKGEVPVDLVTASGSGLDPHISPESALVQADRVAKTRGLKTEAIVALVKKNVEGPQFGIFGEPVVNVLRLNVDLDHSFPGTSPAE